MRSSSRECTRDRAAKKPSQGFCSKRGERIVDTSSRHHRVVRRQIRPSDQVRPFGCHHPKARREDTRKSVGSVKSLTRGGMLPGWLLPRSCSSASML